VIFGAELETLISQLTLVLRGVEIHADVILKMWMVFMTQIRRKSQAVKFDSISFEDVLG
jgi:uridylate kinase